jgi:argininosuccinate synthase
VHVLPRLRLFLFSIKVNKPHIHFRAATPDDVPPIVALVAANARKGGLLPRSEASIRATLHNFMVAEMSSPTEPSASEQTVSAKKVVGCGALLPMNANLVELRSLAVDETIRGAGIGQKLVAALIEEARRRHFGTIFALTRAIDFFLKSGFVITPKEQFPEKVWRDCVACPMLANCDEVAVTMQLTTVSPDKPAPIIAPTATTTPIDTALPIGAILENPLPANDVSVAPRAKPHSQKSRVNKVVLAYSGGLDTSVIVPWLKEMYHCEVVCFTANIGQDDNLDEIREKALQSGASKSIVLDLRDEFANEYLFPLIQSGAIYEDRYLLGSAISRPLIAKYQVEIAAQEGADAVAHGNTGKGNDQVRFELSYYALNPRLKIIAPWREWQFRGREDLLKYAKAHGIPIEQSVANIYTRDENLWHVVHEGGPLEDLDNEPEPDMYQFTVAPESAPDQAEYVEVDFINGIPKRINGKALGGAALIDVLNDIGTKHGIGRYESVENRLIGLKSRQVDEVPGGTILRAAHQGLEQITLDRNTMHFKQMVALRYAELVYNGQWFTPLRDALQAFVAVTQRDVTGTVRLKLYKGNVNVVGRKANYSLYREDLATFMREDAYEHADAGGFIRLYGLPLRIKAQVDMNRAAFAPPVIPSSGGTKRD